MNLAVARAQTAASPTLRVLVIDASALIATAVGRLALRHFPGARIEHHDRPDAALAELSKHPADVVICDHEVDGWSAESLLGEVQLRHPHTVRIVLSCNDDVRVATRSMHVAHQVMLKPIDVGRAERALLDAGALRALLSDPQLRKLVAGDNDLPSRPSLYAELEQRLAKPHAPLGAIATLIEGDVALSARVIQLANSSFFGRRVAATTIQQAVVQLGTVPMKALVLRHEIQRAFRCRSDAISIDALHAEALAAAHLAAVIAKRRGLGSDATGDAEQDLQVARLATMMCSIGDLVLASRAPHELDVAASTARRDGTSLAWALRRELGATGAEVGAYLLGLWGLPNRMVRAVALHNRPWATRRQDWALPAITYVASRLARNPEAALVDESRDDVDALSAPYLEKLGALADLAVWRELALSA